MNLHQIEFQKSIKETMVANYQDFLNELKSELDLNHPFLDEYFSSTLDSEIKGNEDLQNYTSKKFFWLNQVEALIYLLGLCEEYEESEADYEKEEVEEEIFFFWDSSEHSKVFLDYLNEGNSPWEATQEMIPMLENQILAYYFLQIKGQYNQSQKLLYTIVPELGESSEKLYLGESNKTVNYNSSNIKTFPTLVIDSLSDETITIEGKEYSLEENSQLIIRENLNLIPSCKKGEEKFESFKTDILKALSIIEKNSPNCYQAFNNFTHSLIPVNEKNIVSYSMQSLPAFSSINMFDRDFVDLIDDLIHENGHHVLNAILNDHSLMNEDDDKIYYSPWRRALRPVRGIYHAVATFYWALELFSDLFNNIESIDELNSSEKNKVAFRVCEEFLMLSYCEEDLEHAFKLEKVTEEGKSLIDYIVQLIKSKNKTYDLALEFLKNNSSENYDEITKLDSHLGEQAKKYRK